MTATNGFAASTEVDSADRIRIFVGDTTPGQTAYINYYFKRGSAAANWSNETDNTEADSAPLFDAFRAAFIVTTDGAPEWSLPKPY